MKKKRSKMKKKGKKSLFTTIPEGPFKIDNILMALSKPSAIISQNHVDGCLIKTETGFQVFLRIYSFSAKLQKRLEKKAVKKTAKI